MTPVVELRRCCTSANFVQRYVRDAFCSVRPRVAINRSQKLSTAHRNWRDSFQNGKRSVVVAAGWSIPARV
jgi:hypothetical protein